MSFSLDENNKKFFTLLSKREVSEENLIIYEILHNVTKCKILLFEIDDKNRVFNIAFKTPVDNSKGIPHILEHSVLCGSSKYNIKDPFVELAKTSPNTFLNAMTFPDKTCYPVASANLKDFHNLMDVYLDSVFFPNVVKSDLAFKQEGWHYEISDKNELSVNGVVFNEMKGVYSMPDAVLSQEICATLFPNSTYSYESGGDPKEIFNLSYSEFVDFHKKYYEPSNAIIYLYGHLDFNHELQYLEREYLSKFRYNDVEADIKVCEIHTDDIVEKTSFYNVENLNDKNKSYISYSFATKKSKDNLYNIVLQILKAALFTSDAAVIKVKIEESGITDSLDCVFENELKVGYFSIVAENIDKKYKDQFIKIIGDAMTDIMENGLPIDSIKAQINSLYFDRQEDEYGAYPKGIFFTLNSLSTYLYSDNYYEFIEYKKIFDYLNTIDLNDKNNIFYEVIKEVFIENDAKCINILDPKVGLLLENEKKLNEILDGRKKKLSNEQIQNIKNDIKTLKDYQMSVDTYEELSKLPHITLDDLEEPKKNINYEMMNYKGVDMLVSHDNDKDICYMTFNFDITDLSDGEIYFLSVVVVDLILKIDLDGISFDDFNNYIDINTGGVNISNSIYENKTFLSFEIKFEHDKVAEALDIFDKIFKKTIFNDATRIKLLMSESKMNNWFSLLSQGHISTMNRALSNICRRCKIMDMTANTGIASFLFCKAFIETYSENVELYNKALKVVFMKALTNKLLVSLSVNKKHYTTVNEKIMSYISILSEYVDKLKVVSYEDEIEELFAKIDAIIDFKSFDKRKGKEAIVCKNDVNFVSVANAFDKNIYSGSLVFLRTLLNYEYLWNEIRVLGGAYGCMSTFLRDGFYTLSSYRDPNFTNTIEVYDKVSKYLENLDIDDEKVVNYIIGSIGIYDNPMSMYMKYKNNIMAHINGIDNDYMINRRNDLIKTDKNKIKSMSKVFSNSHTEMTSLIKAMDKNVAKDFCDSVWMIEL